MKQPVDFVIITALEEELEAVLTRLPGYKKLPPSKDSVRCYYQAELSATFPDGNQCIYHIIVISLPGMGRVQAANATSDAITQWRPRYLLLVGIAGGIAERRVNLGDILISDQVVDYELQKITAEGPEIRWEVHRADPRLLDAARNLRIDGWIDTIDVERPKAGIPVRHIGPIASGDKVIAFEDTLEKYRSVWPKLIGVEMEAAGAAAAAFQTAHPPGFFMIRSVSDLADENRGTDYVEKWRNYACNAAAAYVIEFLRSGPVPSDSPHEGASFPTDFEQDTDNMHQSTSSSSLEPHIITITGASGSGKSSVLRYMRSIKSVGFKPEIIAKYTTRHHHKDDDRDEIIHVSEIPPNCDLVYEQYGSRYGLSLKTLRDHISRGSSPIVILNDIRAVEDVRSIFGKNVKSIFIHREQLTLESYKEIAKAKGIVDKTELDTRFAKAQTLFRTYIENIHLFDHVIINRQAPDTEGFIELEDQVRQVLKSIGKTQEHVVNNKNRRVMVLVGSPGSGKDSLIRAMDAMGKQHANIVPKHTTRERQRDDGSEMIFKGNSDYDLTACDITYKNFNDDYGIKSLAIDEIIQDNKFAVVVVSNIYAINKLYERFEDLVTLIYVHSNMDADEYRRNQENENIEPQYIRPRFLEYQSAFDLYRKNFLRFDHVLINSGIPEDLSDQLFRLFRVYEHSGFYIA